MRMSSTTKKGEKGKSSFNSSHPLNKEIATHPSNKISATKASELKTAETSKPTEQLNPKVLPTAEQLRIAQMISDSKRDDPELPDKVNKVVELTNCSADAAIIALHDSNNDLDSAVMALLEGDTEGDWEVSGKKKKPKQSSQQQATNEGPDVAHVSGGAGSGRGRDRDRSRGGRGGPPRLRGRGRGRDNKENFEDVEGDALNGSSRGRGSRSGQRMSNGSGREGSSGRGGRAGRGGYRRGQRGPPQSAEVWEEGSEYPALTNVEPWNNDFPSADDWDNEEYIGSLAETKVFTPSQAAAASVPSTTLTSEQTHLPNGSASVGSVNESLTSSAPSTSATAPQVHYANINNSAQQGIDLNALLQKTSGITVAGSALQQPFLQYGAQATDALKAAMGMSSSSAGPKSAKSLRPKIPSKIPSSAVEMPDDPVVSGLDVKFGTLDFGVEPSGFELGLDTAVSSTTAANSTLTKPPEHLQHTQTHTLTQKMEYSSASAQPPAPSALPKPDSSLGGFSTSLPSAVQQSTTTTAAQVKSTNSPASYPYGTSYAPSGVNTTSTQASSSGSSQPAGAYPSNSQTSAGGVYSSSSGSAPMTYQGASNQTGFGSYGQQQPQTTQQAQLTQQQQPSQPQQQLFTSTGYPAAPVNHTKIPTSSGLTDATGTASTSRGDLPSVTVTSSTTRAPTGSGTTTTAATTASKPATSTTALAAGSSGLPNVPPGVPMLGPGSFIMGQAQALPYYAAAAAAGIQQHTMYSIEDMQYRYPHLATGYYDMSYQSPASLGTGREGTLASLAYAGSDAKFSRNENNSPVPTSLSQNAQSHGGAFITPAAAAPTPLTPAYAYYYSGGVMPGGYQFGAPAALYPVSAAASGHAGSGAVAQYGKGGPLGATAAAAAPPAQTTTGATGAGPTNATASAYASYGSSYDDFKSVYNPVGVSSAAAQATKIGGVGASTGPSAVSATGSADLGVGPNVYGKTHNQIGKINTYDKTGGFHTGTPPPYGLTGNANAAPLGVGVGGPSPYGAQHMFIPTLAPHQSQHSHLMHQQLHQDSNTGTGQRSQTGGQQNKQGSKPSYGGSYWGSN